MLSKSQISLITSLQHKKYRKQHGLFIVEGIKSILEFIHSDYQIETILATSLAQAKLGKIPQNIKFELLTEQEFGKISQLTSPQGAMALVRIPEADQFDISDIATGHTLVLDEVQDPGNMGTIIRTAEWFGFPAILCSLGTVDAYNPKVVQATMGSLSRVKIIYLDIEEFINNSSMTTFGAVLQGTSIYKTNFGDQGLVILGNEGNGIRPTLINKIDQAVTIPAYGKAESLNVAVATTVFCSEIARRRK